MVGEVPESMRQPVRSVDVFELIASWPGLRQAIGVVGIVAFVGPAVLALAQAGAVVLLPVVFEVMLFLVPMGIVLWGREPRAAARANLVLFVAIMLVLNVAMFLIDLARADGLVPHAFREPVAWIAFVVSLLPLASQIVVTVPWLMARPAALPQRP